MLLSKCRSTVLIYNKNNKTLKCQKITNALKNSMIIPSSSILSFSSSSSPTPPSSSTTPPPSSSTSSSSITPTSHIEPSTTSKTLRFFDNPSGKHKTPKKRYIYSFFLF